MKMSKFFTAVLLVLIIGCTSKVAQPKAEGYVRLEYPEAEYSAFQSDCPFTFQYSNQALLEKDSQCWYTLSYPKLKAKLYLTFYSTRRNELPTYIKQSEKLVFEHTVMASGIEPKIFINEEENVYGTFYELMGESATNFQFYVTDSASHFLQGSFYFRAQPKPDSLQPAVDYIKKDLKELMETVRWK